MLKEKETKIYAAKDIYWGKFNDEHTSFRPSAFIKTEYEDVYREVIFRDLCTTNFKALFKELNKDIPYKGVLIFEHFNEHLESSMKEFLSPSYTDEDILDVLRIYVMVSTNTIDKEMLSVINKIVSLASSYCVESIKETSTEKQEKKFKKSLENRLRRKLMINLENLIFDDSNLTIPTELLLYACNDASISNVFNEEQTIPLTLGQMITPQQKEKKKKIKIIKKC